MTTWRMTLDLSDVFHSDKPFPERRDEMVARIHGLNLLLGADPALKEIAGDLAATTDVDEWDAVWNWFYDWADLNRVWVRTW